MPVNNKDYSSCFLKKTKNECKGKEKKTLIPTIPSPFVPAKHKRNSEQAIITHYYVVMLSEQLLCCLQNPSVVRVSRGLCHFQWLPMKRCCLMLLIATRMLGLKPTKIIFLTSTMVAIVLMGRTSLL